MPENQFLSFVINLLTKTTYSLKFNIFFKDLSFFIEYLFTVPSNFFRFVALETNEGQVMPRTSTISIYKQVFFVPIERKLYKLFCILVFTCLKSYWTSNALQIRLVFYFLGFIVRWMSSINLTDGNKLSIGGQLPMGDYQVYGCYMYIISHRYEVAILNPNS